MMPPATELTAPFWTAVERHQLVRPVCQTCGRSFFTPQIACTHCLSEDWKYQPSAGRGTVYSATVVHRPPSPDFEVPFRLGIMDIVDEGWSMLANIVGGSAQHPPPFGAQVRVTWIERNGRTLPAFTEAP